jgi:hypothetical protein
MKPIEYYSTNPVPYPSRKEFTEVYAYKKGETVFHGTLPEFEIWENQKGNTAATNEKIIDENGYKKAYAAYREKDYDLKQEFQADLLEEYGVTDHPKAELCFQKAWDEGHSCGYESVKGCFDDLVELIL